MKNYAFIFFSLVAGCTPIAQTTSNSDSHTKVLRNIDFAYEPQVKSIVIRTTDGGPQAYLRPAVTRLGQWNLLLEFDDLQPSHNTYYLRIIHCNRDWSRSDLQDLDFMNDFNEVTINNYEFSVDTHLAYVHYWVNLPPVKLPGNYMAVVYREGDKNDIILSKRFMVYDTRISFENERSLIGAGSVASLNQQINFTVNYKNLDLINPMENINVTIRQNQRWDNMATDVKPSFVREIEKQLEYRFFDETKMFKGSNEFRFFDLRSLNSPGRNVRSVNKTTKPFQVFLERDKSRADEAYAQYPDYNGSFLFDNFDFRNRTYTNYAHVYFTLSSPPLPGDVFVTGAFNYWNLNNENIMQYDSIRKEYQATVLLKQGWYDYQYLVKSKSLPPYHLEGSHFETENLYEILVYYRAFQPRADLLIGYLQVSRNER